MTVDSYFGDLEPVCREKWAQLDGRLARRGVGGIFAWDLPSVRYLTGYLPYLTLSGGGGQPCLYLAGRRRPVLFPVGYYADFARRTCPWLDIRPRPGDERAIAEVVAGIWRAEAPSGEHLAVSGLGAALDAALRQALGDDTIVAGERLQAEARAVKTPAEIGLLRESVAVAEHGMRAALAALAEGRSECEVAGAAEFAMRVLGTESHAVAIRGSNAAWLQEVSTNARFERGDMALVDLGCYRRGYRAEFARTRVVGPASAEQAELMRAVEQALTEAASLLCPGVTCGAVAQRAEAVIADAGYGAFAHPYPVGHGLGVTGQEFPLFVPDSTVPLEANMVVNLEPGIFIRDKAVGIRIEDIWQITSDGAVLLTGGVPRRE